MEKTQSPGQCGGMLVGNGNATIATQQLKLNSLVNRPGGMGISSIAFTKFLPILYY